MNLTVTFIDSDVVLAVEVSPNMTVSDLRAYAREEAGYKVDPSTAVYHNNTELKDTLTLEQAGIANNDMVLMSATSARYASDNSQDFSGNARANPSNNNDVLSTTATSDKESTLSMQIEAARQQILYDPQLFTQLSQQSPELADALHDPKRFQTAYRKLQKQQLKVKAENDEIDRNFRLALEEMPEAFTTVTMLFANIEVNGVPVKAFIDSGAQTTIMSPEFAERCHLTHLIDKRHRGMAYGVGQATILGRIHMAPIKIGSNYFACSMTVIEGTNMEFLLGLDMLKHHQATLDLKHNRLIMGQEELPFLTESEIPKNLVGSPVPAGTALVDKPGTGMPRGTTLNIGGVVGDQGEKNYGNSDSSQEVSQDAGSSNAVPRVSSTSMPPRTSFMPSNATPSDNAASSNNIATPSDHSYDSKVVQNLMNLGFTKNQVMKALSEASGNADVAASILFGE